MKKERKEALLNRFPAVPERLMDEMKRQISKHSAENFVIFLTNEDELFARCFHRYYNDKIIERQRYVFAKDGCFRCGSDDGEKWKIRKEFSEPIFCASSYGYNFDNSYTVLNREAIDQSCMRYCCLDKYRGQLTMEYLKFYTMHPNVEYLMKSGYEGVIRETEAFYYWSVRYKLEAYSGINWKSNNLLKMLGLTREEFKLLKGSENLYEFYREWKKKFPQYKPQELLLLSKAFRLNFGEVDFISRYLDVRLPRLAKYIEDQKITSSDYKDYLEQCIALDYNLNDTAICMPYNFNEMHTRLSKIIKYKGSKVERKLFDKNYPARKALEFETDKFLIRQPNSIGEIIDEGAALEHCVGGYADRHARGDLTIMFLRKKSAPDKPYYTIEVSNEYKIVQCRGYRNNAKNPKPKSVKNFEKQYQEYLNGIKAEKERSKKNETGNKRKSRGNGRVHQGSESQPQDNNGGAARAAVAV